MSKNVAVIGGFWGDEGKGKIVDFLARDSDCVARYQGGPNAGHNVKLRSGLKITLHQIPSGVLYSEVINYMGNGMVIDDEALIAERNNLTSKGIKINSNNLRISEAATLITPMHVFEDCITEISLNIGTTLRGIGPAYKDRVERRALLFSDLIELDEGDLEKRLKTKFDGVLELAKFRGITPESFEKWLDNDENRRKMLKDFLEKSYCPDKFIDFNKVLENKLKTRKELSKYVADVAFELYSAYSRKKSILFEGSQGTLLDVGLGTYPYVTSSNPSIGGIFTGTGVYIPLDKVLIVGKAFTTRVGNGPFPTEIKEREISDNLASDGTEVGSTTGRKRRIGWFDSVMARRSKMINGATSLVLTKLDRLDELDEIKICYAYEGNTNPFNASQECSPIVRKLGQYKPMYVTMPGWKTSTEGIIIYKDLPKQARAYVEEIEKIVGLPISIIGTGGNREDAIVRNISK